MLVVDRAGPERETTAGLLSAQGYAVIVADRLADALQQVGPGKPDLIIVELGLEDRPGSDACRQLKQRSDAPLFAYSRQGDPLDRVAALEFGADDVLEKDCHELEFIARVRALLRRGRPQRTNAPQKKAVWLLNRGRRTLTTATGEEISLSPSESAVFEAFAGRPGAILPTSDLAACVGLGKGSDPTTSMRMRMTRIRNRLRSAGCHVMPIRTVRRDGYEFDGVLWTVG